MNKLFEPLRHSWIARDRENAEGIAEKILTEVQGVSFRTSA